MIILTSRLGSIIDRVWVNPHYIVRFYAEERHGGPYALDPGSQVVLTHNVRLSVKETPEEIFHLIKMLDHERVCKERT